VEEDKTKPLYDQRQICLQQAIGEGGLSCSPVGYFEWENTQTSLVSTAVDTDLAALKKTSVHV